MSRLAWARLPASHSLLKRELLYCVLGGLALWVIATLCGVGLMLGAKSGFDRDLGVLARQLALNVEASGAALSRMPVSLAGTERLFVREGASFAAVLDDYRLAYRVRDQQGRLLAEAGGLPADKDEALGQGFGDLKTGTETWRIFVLRDVGKGFVVTVGERSAMRWARVSVLIRALALPVLCVSLLLAVLVWLSGRRLLAPVKAIAGLISVRSTESLAPVEVPVVYAETAPLLAVLNRLLADARRRIEDERGFLADAAHELRTPLAVVATQAHLLAIADTEADRSQALADLNAGLERASHLARQLLTSARVDGRDQADVVVIEDIVPLVQERVALQVQIALRKAIQVTLDAPHFLPARVDAFGIASVIDNLVDNAIRYTPNEGRIEVRLEITADSICIQVSDSGPGIPATEHEKVLQRFYRLPGSGVPGSGLGLCIVSRVVEQHNGQLSFGPGLDGKGLSVRICLPRSPEADPPLITMMRTRFRKLIEEV